MACLFACFRSSKCSKINHISPTRRTQEPTASAASSESAKRVDEEPLVKEKTEVEGLKSGAEKKVAFDAEEVFDVLPDIEQEEEEDEAEKDRASSDVTLNPSYEGGDTGGFDNDLDKNDLNVIEEESSESLFSLSIDSRKHRVCAVETEEKEVNSSPFRIRRSVLKPIKNLSEWKKEATSSSLKNAEKENSGFEQENVLILPLSSRGIAVETSLSSWLVDSNSNSSTNSVGNSPLKSSRPDDTAISGTVGSYWSRTGQGSPGSGVLTSNLGLRLVH